MFKYVNRKVVVLIAVLAIITFLLAIITSATKKNTGKASSFITAVEQNDAEKSYTYFSTAQKETLPLSSWRTNLAQINSTINGQTFVRRASDSSTTTTANYEYYDVSVDGKNYVLSLVLVSETGSLKIDSLRFENAGPAANTFQKAEKSNE
jgi:hypothetical protein